MAAKQYKYSLLYRIFWNTFFCVVLLFDAYAMAMVAIEIFKGHLDNTVSQFLFLTAMLAIFFFIPIIQMTSYPNIKYEDDTVYLRSFIRWIKSDIHFVKKINTFVSVGIPHKGEILLMKIRRKPFDKYFCITNSISDYDEIKEIVQKHI